MKSVYHQIIIWVSLPYGSFDFIKSSLNFEEVTNETVKYSFAKILIVDAYMCS